MASHASGDTEERGRNLRGVVGGNTGVDRYLWIQLGPLFLAVIAVVLPAVLIRVFWRRGKSFGER
jgi:hypothetical protein